MTCAKQHVICRIETTTGQVVTGENACNFPQTTCPRDEQGYGTGEGYHLCQEICGQQGHAEQVAVRNMKGRHGVRAHLEGHTYACEPCKEALRSVGVRTLLVDGREEQL